MPSKAPNECHSERSEESLPPAVDSLSMTTLSGVTERGCPYLTKTALDLVIEVFHDLLQRRRNRLAVHFGAFQALYALAQFAHFRRNRR
jgi:hypothetical protein